MHGNYLNSTVYPRGVIIFKEGSQERNLDVICVGEVETTLKDAVLAVKDCGGWPTKNRSRDIAGLAFNSDDLDTMRTFNPLDLKTVGAGKAGREQLIAVSDL